jgi:hypothetical protein
MNVETGTEAALFPEKEYINGIFLAVRFRPGLCSQEERGELSSCPLFLGLKSEDGSGSCDCLQTMSRGPDSILLSYLVEYSEYLLALKCGRTQPVLILLHPITRCNSSFFCLFHKHTICQYLVYSHVGTCWKGKNLRNSPTLASLACLGSSSISVLSLGTHATPYLDGVLDPLLEPTSEHYYTEDKYPQ